MAKLDKAAISISALCILHCLALPFLLVAIPGLGAFVEESVIHTILVIIALPFTLFAIGYMIYSGAFRPLFLGMVVIGFVMLFSGATHLINDEIELIVTIIGGLLVISAHFMNLRDRRRLVTLGE